MTDKPSPKGKNLKTSGNNFAKDPLKDKIGNDLKQMYDDVVNEDVPAEFLALLQDADNNDK